jgi:hypothetical protein
MRSRVSRTATAALVAALGLALPACKKTKPTVLDTPAPATAPAQTPTSGPAAQTPTPDPNGNRDPNAPPSPVFSASYLLNAGNRQAVINNLRQVGLALTLYNDVNNRLPAGYYDKSGKLGLSWRVALLPYLDQNALFKEFRLDEPWDSEHNKTLIERMPPFYAPPRTNTFGYTFLRGFTGPNTWLDPHLTGQAGKPGRAADGVSMLAISDGTSNTILVAEAYDPVIWTKPDELAFAPDNPPKLGGVFEHGAHVLLADGSVKFLRKPFDQKMLAAAIQINDGTPVQFPND